MMNFLSRVFEILKSEGRKTQYIIRFYIFLLIGLFFVSIDIEIKNVNLFESGLTLTVNNYLLYFLFISLSAVFFILSFIQLFHFADILIIELKAKIIKFKNMYHYEVLEPRGAAFADELSLKYEEKMIWVENGHGDLTQLLCRNEKCKSVMMERKVPFKHYEYLCSNCNYKFKDELDYGSLAEKYEKIYEDELNKLNYKSEKERFES